MAEPLAYLNGEFLPLARASLPLTDGGFINGATVTDNCRTWSRKLFRWADHQARFRHDCEACRVPLKLDDAAITALAERLVAENAAILNDDLHLVTFATPATFGLFTRPIDRARHRQFQESGVRLRVVGHQPVDSTAVLSPRWKHRSRMVWHIAQDIAGPDAVAVLLDRPDGTLTETAIANVLAVIDGVLVTPPRRLLLDGISLKVALELAEKNGLRWEEREIRRADWQRSQEMFLAGTGFGIAGVSQIDDNAVPWPGPVCQRLQAAWENEVRR
jgi:branched-subunit amino acid aminotransferase/4-amino-4-deoxychorismate lyase